MFRDKHLHQIASVSKFLVYDYLQHVSVIFDVHLMCARTRKPIRASVTDYPQDLSGDEKLSFFCRPTALESNVEHFFVPFQRLIKNRGYSYIHI